MNLFDIILMKEFLELEYDFGDLSTAYEFPYSLTVQTNLHIYDVIVILIDIIALILIAGFFMSRFRIIQKRP